MNKERGCLPFISNRMLLNTSMIKIYASTLYERWFAEGSENCNQANVLALIILDGLVNDVRKLPYVRIHTGEW